MKRTDNLQENALVQWLTEARRNFDELKSGQQIAGSSNVQMWRVVTGNPFDFSLVLSYHVVTIWEITFTAADTTFDYASFLWRSFFAIYSQSGSGNYQQTIEALPSTPTQQKSRLYAMGTTPGMALTLNMLVIVYAVGNGTISVVKIA